MKKSKALKMKLFTIILMLSFGIGNTHPPGSFQFYLEDEAPALRVFRGNDVQPPETSAHKSMGPQKNTWWWSPEGPYAKRRQNLAYYNLNSFGLRYGKREQNMLAEFKQKSPVK